MSRALLLLSIMIPELLNLSLSSFLLLICCLWLWVFSSAQACQAPLSVSFRTLGKEYHYSRGIMLRCTDKHQHFTHEVKWSMSTKQMNTYKNVQQWCTTYNTLDSVLRYMALKACANNKRWQSHYVDLQLWKTNTGGPVYTSLDVSSLRRSHSHLAYTVGLLFTDNVS